MCTVLQCSDFVAAVRLVKLEFRGYSDWGIDTGFNLKWFLQGICDDVVWDGLQSFSSGAGVTLDSVILRLLGSA